MRRTREELRTRVFFGVFIVLLTLLAFAAGFLVAQISEKEPIQIISYEKTRVATYCDHS